MKDVQLEIVSNEKIADMIYKMKLRGDVSEIERPGQFINIKLEGRFLRRPISVYDKDNESLTIIYKTLGHGTEDMSKMQPGEKLMALTGLGNGYQTFRSGDKPVLLGGGVGTPPLYLLCKQLLAEGKHPSIVLGFNTDKEIFCEEEFRSLGVPVTVTTVDGSYGVKGFVTDALPEDYTYFYTCGPEPMLRAVYKATTTPGEFSFESRMGCGFGACMGCSCKTITGSLRICKDGPVLWKEDILWED